MAGPNSVLPKRNQATQASGSQDKITRAHGGGMAPRFRILAAPGRDRKWLAQDTKRHKRDRAISRSQAGRMDAASRQPGEAGLQKAQGRRRPLLGVRAPSLPALAATRSCMHLPSGSLPARLRPLAARALAGPWRRREATPVGAGRP